MESNNSKKKQVWGEISKELKFKCDAKHAESKWKTLVRAHKELLLSKKKSGGKRKDFQFYNEMVDILKVRHDINPPLVLGSGIVAPIVKKQYGELDISEDEQMPTKKTKSDSSPAGEGKGSAAGEEKGSAAGKGKGKGKRTKEKEPEIGIQMLQFLKESEKQRLVENHKKEENANKRAGERNVLLQGFLDVFKKC